jgi:hypothetical protein
VKRKRFRQFEWVSLVSGPKNRPTVVTGRYIRAGAWVTAAGRGAWGVYSDGSYGQIKFHGNGGQKTEAAWGGVTGGQIPKAFLKFRLRSGDN